MLLANNTFHKRFNHYIQGSTEQPTRLIICQDCEIIYADE